MLRGMVALGEVLEQRKLFVEIDDSRTYKRCRVRLHAQGIVLRDSVLGADIKTKRQQPCFADDFLVAEIDAKVGGFGIVPRELDGAMVSSHYFLFKINPARLDPRYLALVIRTAPFQDQVTAKGSTNYAAIRPGDVLRYEVPLPSMDEQRNAVVLMQRMERLLDEAESLQARARAERSMLFGRVAKDRFDEGRAAGWPVRELGDVLVEARYGTSSKTHDEPVGVPVLRMGNIQDGKLVYGDLKYLELGPLDQVLLLRPGDILVNRTNSAELVGKCAVFDHAGAYAFASYIIRLRTEPGIADPSYVALYLNSPAGRSYMFSNRKQMTGQANVNATILRALPIPLPPFEEQRRVASELETWKERLEGLRARQQTTERALAALRKAVVVKTLRLAS